MSDRLVQLLAKHGLSKTQFAKRGRLPKDSAWILKARKAIVTELHSAGTPWLEMCKVTGFSLGTINRLSDACWNANSRGNRQASAARVGRCGKGEVKPWLTRRLKKEWETGKFDFHRGRVRSESEREKLRAAGARPEVRAQRTASAQRRWKDPKQREQLVAFHRSSEQRRIRSEAQVARMKADPSKWARGIGLRVAAQKCTKPTIFTRSSYERRMVNVLDADPDVGFYDFEPILRDRDGWFIPDFIVFSTSGVCLIEVKASWVLQLPSDHKVKRRLERARRYAASKSWDFRIWYGG